MNKRVRFGLIGTGLWGQVHAEIYSTHPFAELAAVCDSDPTRANRVAKKYGAGKIFSDYRKMVKDPGIDAVAVVTPDFAHREPIVAAARAGKHILTEKPLATTLEDAETVAEAVPDRECLVFRGRRLSFGDVTDRTRRLANYPLDRGLGLHRERSELQPWESGQDHLALYLYNGNEYLEGMLGAYKARVAPFNVNYRYVEQELIYLLHLHFGLLRGFRIAQFYE